MIKFICLFFPAVLSVWLYEYLSKTDHKGKRLGMLYLLDVLLVNSLCFAVKTYILGTGAYSLTDATNDMVPSVALNYLILSVLISVIVAIVQAFCRKNIKLSIEETADDNQV